MRLGKLFIGWRDMPDWEAVGFGLSRASSWRGFFIEWGTAERAAGFLLMIEAKGQ